MQFKDLDHSYNLTSAFIKMCLLLKLLYFRSVYIFIERNNGTKINQLTTIYNHMSCFLPQCLLNITWLFTPPPPSPKASFWQTHSGGHCFLLYFYYKLWTPCKGPCLTSWYRDLSKLNFTVYQKANNKVWILQAICI